MNTMNTSSFESNQNSLNVDQDLFGDFPTAADYYSDITPEAVFSISGCAILCALTNFIFFYNIPSILKNTPKNYVTRTLILCCYYPVVAVASLASTLIPKSVLICDTICHLGFTICAYQFFCLCLDYIKGETNFIKIAEDRHVFNVRTPPCCCWMTFVKPKMITKENFLIVRLLILQLPIVQVTLFVTFNIVFLEDAKFFDSFLLYFAPLIIVSILVGVWGLQITARMISPLYPELRIMAKYICLQLVLIMVKLQPQISLLIVSNLNTGMKYPITPRVLSNLIVQLIIQIEMVILSIWAQKLYKTPSIEELQ